MKKKQQVNNTKVLEQPTIYAFDLCDIPIDNYMETLNVLFHNPDFKANVGTRNKLVKASDRLRNGSPEMQNLIRTIQSKDRKLADTIFASLVKTNIHSKEKCDFYSFNQLLRFFVDYSREGMQDKINQLSTNLDKITFLSDMLEGIMIDIKSEMQFVFNNEVAFHQFDTVSEVLKQLTGFFNSTRNSQSNVDDKNLYIEYSDSINNYIEKRLKTYSTKYQKRHPLPKIYTQQDMIDALNQFFGTNKFFGANFIGHTKSGGKYIDAMALANNLTASQTNKLDALVKDVPKNANREAMEKYSFSITDAIMSQYSPDKTDDNEIR